MTRLALASAAILALAACSQEAAPPSGESAAVSAPTDAASAPAAAPAIPTSAATGAGKPFPSGTWDMVSSGEGDGLFFGTSEGEPGKLHLFCSSGGGLLVNANALRPASGATSMVLGTGAASVTLAADPKGDSDRGGVSGEGAVPADLAALLTAREGVTATYGTQSIGPLPPVPADLARDFQSGCTD